MHYSLDFRFLVPALIRFIALLEGQEDELYKKSTFNLNFFFFFFLLSVVILVFLFTSIKLPLQVSIGARPVRVQLGEFSAPLAILLVISVFFPGRIFWVGYGITILVSPWYDLLARFWSRVWGFLQAIPLLILSFSCIAQQDQLETGESEQGQVAEVMLDEPEIVHHVQLSNPN